MKTRYADLLLFALLMLGGMVVYGQSEQSSIRFVEKPQLEDVTKCFDVEVRTNSADDIKLGSQNYRMYYDANRMRFLRDMTNSHLTEYSYTEAKVLQAVHNSNASGFGNLEFSSSLGFINININDIGDTRNLLSLRPHNWTPTLELCFEIFDPAAPLNIIWAREGVTDGYATAFTALSIIKGKVSESTEIILYEDLQQDDQEYQLRIATSQFKN